MTKLTFKVSVAPTTIEVSRFDYQEEWDEHCSENGDGSGEDYGEPTDEFIRGRVQEEFNDGTRDLNEAFEFEEVTAEAAE